MRKSISGPLGLFVFVFPLTIAAEDLSEVVITANRVPEPLDAALAATTVLTRELIQARQATSIEDLLQGVEGLSIGNSGGPGKLTSFFVRGADADHLLVLVDGVRIGSATAGTAALQNLPVEMIERIEFVRGPRSSLYGSDAIGGVLQIFTHRHTGDGFRPEFALTGGSLGTRRGYAALAGGDDRAWFRVQASAEATRGFDACRGSSTQFAGCFTEEPDADGYRYRSGSLAAGWQLDEHTRIEGNLLRATSHVEYDGSFTNESRILQQVAGVSASREIGSGRASAVHPRPRLGSFARLPGRQLRGSIPDAPRQRQPAVEFPLAVGRLLTLGVDHQRDHVASDTAYVSSARNNTALFAQFVGDAGPWRTEFSLRGDDNAQFGQHATGTAAIGYAWSDAIQLLVQAGTGFKAPSFNDLYYPFFGNPELDPERSRSFELALRGHADSARWRLSLFATTVPRPDRPGRELSAGEYRHGASARHRGRAPPRIAPPAPTRVCGGRRPPGIWIWNAALARMCSEFGGWVRVTGRTTPPTPGAWVAMAHSTCGPKRGSRATGDCRCVRRTCWTGATKPWRSTTSLAELRCDVAVTPRIEPGIGGSAAGHWAGCRGAVHVPGLQQLPIGRCIAR